jgi:hypothetical protein
VEEPLVEEELDEDLGHAPALAHRHRGCTLFDPSLGGDRFIYNAR